MPSISDERNTNVSVQKEGWLSLQGSQGLARPVRGVLTDHTFSAYASLERTRLATEPATKAGSTTSLVSEPLYASAGEGSTASLGVPGVSVAYKSVDAPHPGFPDALNAEAVAHNLLFGSGPDSSYAAIVLASPVVEVANMLCAYIELLVNRGLAGAQSGTAPALTPPVAERVAGYCDAVLKFPAVVMNATATASVLRLVSSLRLLDAQLAESLKASLTKAQEASQRTLQLSFTPRNGSESSPPVSSSRWAPRLLKLAENGHRLPAGALLDPGFVDEFATQIAGFHRRLWQHWAPTSDLSLLFHTPQSCAAWQTNPLVFDTESFHFLGTLAMHHIFLPGIADTQRAKLIEKWIYLATRLRELGDSVGWVAVLIALFDPSVLRLTNTWSNVDRTLTARLAHGWGYEAFEVAKRAKIPFLQKKTFRTDTEDIGKRVAKADCVPYFGDAIIQDSHPHDTSVASEQLRRLETVLSGWDAYLASIRDEAAPTSIEEDPAHQVLLAVWAKQHPIENRPDKAALSLSVQPKSLGHYLPNFYQQSLPLTSGAMIPVLFTTAMPNFRLFPRSTLLLASQPKPSHKPRNTLRRSSSFPPAGPPLTTGVTELDTGAREQLENTASAHVLGKVVRDLLNVGTDTIEVDPGLVFKAFTSDEFTNMRSSRTSSIIETLNKRSSAMGKQVVVKAASMVRLVDVLVLGAGAFAYELSLDADAHISTLLATYRSFCSPAEMIDMLQVRVRCARGAARVLSEQAQRGNNTISARQQIWQVSEDDDRTDAVATRIISMIMTMLQKWIEECFFDFMDDQFVLDAGNALLTALRQEVAIGNYPDSVMSQCRRVTGGYLRRRYSIERNDSLTSSWLPLIFNDNRQKRHEKVPAAPPELPVTSLEHDGGIAQINAMIDELDVIVADAFSRITMIHWMKLFEVLEQQTVSTVGLFKYATQSYATEADVIVQNVFSWLCSLQLPNSKTPVLDVLPEPIVALVRLHCSLVTYFAAQVADPSLAHAHERHDRMAFMLKMLGVLRARMQFFNLASDFDDQQSQHIPSFLEQAVVAAILLPESRAYAHSWQVAGNEVARMFPRGQPLWGGASGAHDAEPNARTIYVPAISIKQGSPMTVCIGWVVERLLEIVCCVPNASVDHPDLINFDKRRYAYNLIKNMKTEFSVSDTSPVEREILVKYYFLFGEGAKHAYVASPVVDKRLHKESVAREGKTKTKVFVDIIAQELEKMKIENRLYEKLERANHESAGISKSSSFYGLPVSQSSTSIYSKRLSRLIPSTSTVDVASVLDASGREQLGSNGSNSSSAGTANSTSLPPTPSKRQPVNAHHQKRSRFGSFFKAVRPLSVLGVSGASSGMSAGSGSQGQVSSPTPAQVPTSGSLYTHQAGSGMSFQSALEEQQQQQGAAQDAQWVPDESIELATKPAIADLPPDAWQMVVSVDVGHMCNVELRAPTTLLITHRPGPKPEYVLLRAPSAEVASEWHSRTYSAMQDCLMQSTRVFGVPLQIVCARENRTVPAFLETLLSQIEDRGLDDVGIYRISGSLAAVNAMKQWFDQGNASYKHDDPKWADINAVAGCIKLYLRELPQPLMTEELLPELMGAIGPTGVDLDLLRAAITKLPSPNFYVLKRLTAHLRLIVEHSQQNKMNMQNIAIVFSVNFLPPVAMSQMGGMQQIVSALVLQRDHVFFQVQ